MRAMHGITMDGVVRIRCAAWNALNLRAELASGSGSEEAGREQRDRAKQKSEAIAERLQTPDAPNILGEKEDHDASAGRARPIRKALRS